MKLSGFNSTDNQARADRFDVREVYFRDLDNFIKAQNMYLPLLAYIDERKWDDGDFAKELAAMSPSDREAKIAELQSNPIYILGGVLTSIAHAQNLIVNASIRSRIDQCEILKLGSYKFIYENEATRDAIRDFVCRNLHHTILLIGDAGAGKTERIEGYQRDLAACMRQFGFRPSELYDTKHQYGCWFDKESLMKNEWRKDAKGDIVPSRKEAMKALVGFKQITLGNMDAGEGNGIALPNGTRIFPDNYPIYNENQPYRPNTVRDANGNMKAQHNDAPYGIFFLDELTSASIEQQIPAMKLLDKSRQVNSYYLPDGWMTYAAGNGKEWNNFNTLSMPVLSRCIAFRVLVDVGSWIDWASKHGIDNHIITYLSIKPENVIKNTKEKEYENYADLETAGQHDSIVLQLPSPRTWATLSDMLGLFESKLDLLRGRYDVHGKSYDDLVQMLDELRKGDTPTNVTDDDLVPTVDLRETEEDKEKENASIYSYSRRDELMAIASACVGGITATDFVAFCAALDETKLEPMVILTDGRRIFTDSKFKSIVPDKDVKAETMAFIVNELRSVLINSIMSRFVSCMVEKLELKGVVSQTNNRTMAQLMTDKTLFNELRVAGQSGTPLKGLSMLDIFVNVMAFCARMIGIDDKSTDPKSKTGNSDEVSAHTKGLLQVGALVIALARPFGIKPENRILKVLHSLWITFTSGFSNVLRIKDIWQKMGGVDITTLISTADAKTVDNCFNYWCHGIDALGRVQVNGAGTSANSKTEEASKLPQAKELFTVEMLPEDVR